MTRLFIFGFLFILTSCINSRYPTSAREFWGVAQTCNTDSTTLTSDSIIRIKKGVTTRPAYCPTCKYSSCNNKPEYFDFVFFWPVEISLNFKKKEYSFVHSPRPYDSKIKYGEKGYSVAYNFDVGTLKYNQTDNTLTLKSKMYNWTRTFSLNYSKQDSILTLNAKTATNSK